MNKMEHDDCIFDFCGNHNSHGIWADSWKDENGQKYISFGGNWISYFSDYKEREKIIIEKWEGGVEQVGIAMDYLHSQYDYPDFFLIDKEMKLIISSLENCETSQAVNFIEKSLTKKPK